MAELLVLDYLLKRDFSYQDIHLRKEGVELDLVMMKAADLYVFEVKLLANAQGLFTDKILSDKQKARQKSVMNIWSQEEGREINHFLVPVVFLPDSVSVEFFTVL